MSLWINKMVDLLIQYGALGLFVVSFAESSFFPIPPDLILIPLSIINHRLALIYAALTTLSSVLGGLFGYYIGAKAGRPILKKLFSEERISKVKGYFDKYGGWAVAIAGLTPIPYKIFTISSGVFRIRKSVFVNASIIGRGIRFFAEGIIIYMMGDKAQEIISEYFDVLTIGITVFAVFLYFIYAYSKRKFGKDKNKTSGITAVKNTITRYMQYLYKSLLKDFWRIIFIVLSVLVVFLTFILIFIETFEIDVFFLYFYPAVIILMTILFIYCFSFSKKEDSVEHFRDFIRKAFILECLLLILFVGLVYGLMVNDINYMDNIIGQQLLKFHSDFNTAIMKALSFFASSMFLPLAFIVSLFYLIFKIKRIMPGLILIINMTGANFIKIGLKSIFKRPRPELALLVEKEYSFPSGHSLIGFAFYGLLAYYIYKYYNGPWKRVMTTFLILFPLMIGISRIYLVVHYASDVFAGLILGAFWLIFCICADKYYTMKSI